MSLRTEQIIRQAVAIHIRDQEVITPGRPPITVTVRHLGDFEHKRVGSVFGELRPAGNDTRQNHADRKKNPSP
ncbi:MAG TPA: hypothetical protein ENN17_12770 [bacterium]|nr:hypothetical protein [bacterium]